MTRKSTPVAEPYLRQEGRANADEAEDAIDLDEMPFALWYRLAEAATPGPWMHERDDETMESAILAQGKHAPSIIATTPAPASHSRANPCADAAFLAAARTAVPALLAALRQARSRVARLTDLFQGTHGVHHSWVATCERQRVELAEAKAVLAFYAKEASWRLQLHEDIDYPYIPTDSDRGQRARDYLAKVEK